MNTARLFQDFQRLYGFCPCCGELFRLSDARLFYNASPPRTPWDDLNDERARLERGAERLDQDTERLREQAIETGRRERDRRLNGLMSFFHRRRIALHDMKLLFIPSTTWCFVASASARVLPSNFSTANPCPPLTNACSDPSSELSTSETTRGSRCRLKTTAG